MIMRFAWRNNWYRSVTVHPGDGILKARPTLQTNDGSLRRAKHLLLIVVASILAGLNGLTGQSPSVAQTRNYDFDDSHFHLTNYVQEGIDIHKLVDLMGNKVGRVALFGIPLQQQWSFRNDGNRQPTYYLESDSPLYYYSFTDAYIAMSYKSLTPEQQARFDPMITGFNPADMYATDHIKRVLKTFPGVF